MSVAFCWWRFAAASVHRGCVRSDSNCVCCCAIPTALLDFPFFQDVSPLSNPFRAVLEAKMAVWGHVFRTFDPTDGHLCRLYMLDFCYFVSYHAAWCGFLAFARRVMGWDNPLHVYVVMGCHLYLCWLIPHYVHSFNPTLIRAGFFFAFGCGM